MAIPVAAAGGAGDDSGDAVHEAQAILLRLGRRRFASPDPEIEHRIRAIHELERLEELLMRLLEAVNWQDLFPNG